MSDQNESEKKTFDQVYEYRNRMGNTYYLHEGKTKTGKARYFFAKTVRDGARREMPKGFECTESINGVVSVRRKTQEHALIPAEDIHIIEAELRRHRHLRYYRVQADKNSIIIFEPFPKVDDLSRLSRYGYPPSRADIKMRMARAQYSPVMKFDRGEKYYTAYRMTYRGSGGWSWPIKSGKLEVLVKQLVKHIGTDGFYELDL